MSAARIAASLRRTAGVAIFRSQDRPALLYPVGTRGSTQADRA
jgi:hypothetical protein